MTKRRDVLRGAGLVVSGSVLGNVAGPSSSPDTATEGTKAMVPLGNTDTVDSAAGRSGGNAFDVIRLNDTWYDEAGTRFDLSDHTIEVLADGQYYISASIQFNNGVEPGERYHTQVSRNTTDHGWHVISTVAHSSHGQKVTPRGSDVLPLKAGDKLYLMGYNSGTEPVTVDGGRHVTHLTIVPW